MLAAGIGSICLIDTLLKSFGDQSEKGKGMTQTHTLRLHPYGGTAQRERWCERSACARGATRERVPERVLSVCSVENN